MMFGWKAKILSQLGGGTNVGVKSINHLELFLSDQVEGNSEQDNNNP